MVQTGMRVLMVAVLLVGACGGSSSGDDSTVAPDASVEPDAHITHPDDGFGNACDNGMSTPGHSYAECTSLDGMSGICTNDGCRRWCSDPAHDTGCPDGQTPVPTVENKCFCKPPTP